MTAVAAVGRRYLPRGWGDFGLQLAIWFGFLAVYQVARGVADRDPARAIGNGLAVIGWERQHAHHLFELTLQNLASSSVILEWAVSWTYWMSEFPVLGLTLLWVYLRRHDAFPGLRNTILLANVLGLLGYVLAPTAPPRILGVSLAYVCRNRISKVAWLLWPVWVWFSVMATANHFWLDVVAGVGVALVALAIIHRRRVVSVVLRTT